MPLPLLKYKRVFFIYFVNTKCKEYTYSPALSYLKVKHKYTGAKRSSV